jgi:hypothetical protein
LPPMLEVLTLLMAPLEEKIAKFEAVPNAGVHCD